MAICQHDIRAETSFTAAQTTRELPLRDYRHPATAVISSRASGNVSNLPIAASNPSTLASDSGRTAFRAQSRNLASPGISEALIAEPLHPYPAGLVVATKGGLVRPGA